MKFRRPAVFAGICRFRCIFYFSKLIVYLAIVVGFIVLYKREAFRKSSSFGKLSKTSNTQITTKPVEPIERMILAPKIKIKMVL